jgi:hypothetical protein
MEVFTVPNVGSNIARVVFLLKVCTFIQLFSESPTKTKNLFAKLSYMSALFLS